MLLQENKQEQTELLEDYIAKLQDIKQTVDSNKQLDHIQESFIKTHNL